MSIAEKLSTIAENVPKVFDAGKREEYNKFWDAFVTQTDTRGNVTERTNYNYAFYRWNAEYIEPPYKIAPTESNGSYMFGYAGALKEIRKQYFDLSKFAVSPSTSTGTAHYGTFGYCYSIEIIEDIGMQPAYYYNTFRQCEKLHTIEKVRSTVDCLYDRAFYYCHELQNITFEGAIGQNISFSESSKLTTASLLSILTALSKDATYASGKTLTLNTASRAKIEADSNCSEQLALAVSAGWTVAYA